MHNPFWWLPHMPVMLEKQIKPHAAEAFTVLYVDAELSPDDSVAKPMTHALLQLQVHELGDNRPYSGTHPEDCMHDVHAEAAGLPHVETEFGWDLIGHPAGVAKWAGVLTTILGSLLGDESLYTRREGCANDN